MKTKPENTLRNILLIRTDRIGDVVLTTPALTVLRQHYPEARLHFLTRDYTAPILKHHRDLDEILLYQPEGRHRGWSGIRRLARELQARQIDTAFLFFPRPDLALALRLAGIPRRVGIAYRWYSFLLNKRIFEHRKHGRKHELEYNLSLLQPFVSHLPTPEEVQFNFVFDESLRAVRESLLRKGRIQSDYLVVHPGSGGSAPNLPPEMFARIVRFLAEKVSWDILLVGSKSEGPLLEQIQRLAGVERLHRIAGDWNLEEYLAIIAGSRLFISNSTGPLHLARAFEVPLLAFYCPAIPCSPRRWGPYNRPEAVLVPEVEPCNSCNPARCPYGNCLSLIPWEKIQARLISLLS